MNRKWICVLLVIFLTGCQQIYSVEDRAIVQILGYDYVEKDVLKGTVGIPQYGEEEVRTVEELNLTVNAESLKDFSQQVEKESSKPLSMGKLAVTLYNQKLAESGIDEFLDVLSRDPRVGRNIYLGVVDGEVQELIEGKYNQNETTAKYVKGIMENNMQRNFPKTNLHHFLYAYYAEGLDGFLPYIKKRNSHIQISGVALFDGGKMVSVVTDEDVLTLKLLLEEVKEGALPLSPEMGSVGMEITDSNLKYEVDNSKDIPEFDIKVKVTGFINEMKEQELESTQTPGLVNDLETEFKNHLKASADKMIAKFQEDQTDPLGLGNILKNRRRNFDKEKWEEQYPEVPVNVDVEVKITGTGISL
ncbi:Ger(x)C family spore germination protein [Halobacillus sp. A5]|uniref:Ger(x)C family spore germination protein n=1 Tax=Halobacillus sp. A5 TaxID=2880263 RepID=UPI0020A6AD5B|nr:Ger(x)C family spore germination protein [Halobacillus sp. A5]MCP3026826.1 Ger(x)C family spore germination protein [Halobacillus sp. A5]